MYPASATGRTGTAGHNACVILRPSNVGKPTAFLGYLVDLVLDGLNSLLWCWQADPKHRLRQGLNVNAVPLQEVPCQCGFPWSAFHFLRELSRSFVGPTPSRPSFGYLFRCNAFSNATCEAPGETRCSFWAAVNHLKDRLSLTES